MSQSRQWVGAAFTVSTTVAIRPNANVQVGQWDHRVFDLN